MIDRTTSFGEYRPNKSTTPCSGKDSNTFRIVLIALAVSVLRNLLSSCVIVSHKKMLEEVESKCSSNKHCFELPCLSKLVTNADSIPSTTKLHLEEGTTQ